MEISLFDKYGKSIGAFLFFLYTVAIPLWTGDHHIDGSEGLIIAVAIGNGLLVYIVPVTKSLPGLKSVVNVILAGLVVAQTQLAGGIDANDWYLIIGAVVAAIGIPILPAASLKERVRVALGSDKALSV